MKDKLCFIDLFDPDPAVRQAVLDKMAGHPEALALARLLADGYHG